MRPVVERRLPRWSELSEVVRPRRLAGDATDRRLGRAATIGDLREIARRRVPRAVFDYTDGAAGGDQPPPLPGGVRAGRVRPARAARRLRGRPLDDDAGRPVVAPAGPRADRVHPADAHRRGGRGGRVAERIGVPYALSTMGTTSVEALARRHPGPAVVPAVPLARPGGQRGPRRARLRRGLRGPDADRRHAGRGPRLRDVRNGLTIPPALSMRTMANTALHPRWWVDLFTTRRWSSPRCARGEGPSPT